MQYVIGVSKTFNSSKKQRGSEKHRKYHFCYKFDLESGKLRRIRISLFKAIYYKITFIFGLKYKMIGTPKEPIRCSSCNEWYYALVNFWSRDRCPYC